MIRPDRVEFLAAQKNRVAERSAKRAARLLSFETKRTETLVIFDQHVADEEKSAGERARIAQTIAKRAPRVRKRKRQWTVGEISILRELSIQGSSPEETAQALRRTVAEIQKQAEILRLWDLTDKRMVGVTANISSAYFSGRKNSRRPT